jgi:hypothetical protein
MLGHRGKALSKALWSPIQIQVIVSPWRIPTARWLRVIRTDQ